MGGNSTTLSIVLKLVDDATAGMQGVGDKLKSVGESMSSAGRTLSTDVTLPLVGIGVAAVKMASDFQASMTMLVTQAGLPADQLNKLTKAVQDFADSGAQQTPEVLAQGLYHIVSLGVPAAHAMEVLKLASEGASMSQANLEDVASALGAAVASNIKGSGDYQNAMATLNATVGAGNMRMQDLATSLGNVLPQATTAGLSLKDVGAAMATMTDNGMPAADAATRLHMAIALMAAPTKQATEALASIGMTQLQLADDMRNKGMLAALTDLKQHLESVQPATEVLQKHTKMTAEQIAALNQTLGDAKQKLAILEEQHLATAASTLKYGQSITQYAQSQNNAKVAADNHALAIEKLQQSIAGYEAKLGSANTVLKTVGGTMLDANQQAEVLSHAFGGGRSAGAIELLLNNLDRVGQKYDLIDQGVSKFSDDVETQQETAAAKFAMAQAQMADAMVKLGAAMLPLVETLMPKLIGAVTGLVNWFTNLSPSVQTGILVFLGLFAALGPVLIVLGSLFSVIGSLTTAFVFIGPYIYAAGAAILGLSAPLLIIIAAVGVLAFMVYKHWHEIIDWTSDMMLSIAGAWNKGWSGMSNFLGGLLNDVKTAVQDAMNFIMTIVNGAMSAINSVKSAAASVGGAVGHAAGAVGGAFNNTIHAFADGGIVTGPTFALVGEAGPEAIIPLSAFAGGNSLAGSGFGGGGGITINVTGNNISSQMDVRNIAQQVGAEIVRVLRLNQKLSI